MTTSLLRTLKTIRRRNHSQKGFTLIELLIVTIIAGGIVSGLMFLVVELLAADQRDASRNATQQDMQRSMEYMSNELREAVYVYPGNLLNRIVTENRLPPSLTQNSTPVIAFWRQAPLPRGVLNYCSTNWQSQDENGDPPIVDSARQAIPCAAGHAYSLIVYSLDTAGGSDTGGPWTGQARITRYELRPYNDSSGRQQPAPVQGYVSPIVGPRNLFAIWPRDVDETDRQRGRGRPSGAAVPLTDFVDRNRSEETTPTCPSNYSISPLNPPDSFYACVRTGSPNPPPAASPSPSPRPRAASDTIENQEVILYLRGNGLGRPSITENGNNAYRPTLTTRVFNRGTLDVNPNN
ncbi:MAG: prepilin-type N-terminal cleavage/methylation domain-containing protein [Leptolyngbyaceae cyanobacterium SM1_3_5]|nr:prepilin-type N-terminal cleavage/methylation domain-containing protein [Leptolyngbyaceae cyanobacterium SM1_3_5]